MDPFSARAVRSAYDRVAEDYATAFADDLKRLPVDTVVLEEAGKSLLGDGPVLDLGCGPGHVAQFLSLRGVRVIGVDLAPGMLAVARARFSRRPVAAGDLRCLPVRTGSCAGAVAFYSLQHVPRSSLGSALAEIRRVLTRRALLVVAAHLGEGEFFADELLGHTFPKVGGCFYAADEMVQAVAGNGFVVESDRQRGPLPHEHPSQRIYLLARAV